MEEPGAGEAPVARGGGAGDPEDAGGVFLVEPGEEPELDELGFAFVEGAEFFKRVVDGEEGFGGDRFVGFGIGDGEGDTVVVAASFLAFGGAGVVDEYATHDLGGEHHEVVFGVDVDLVGVDEAEEDLVDEGGGLEGVVGAFGIHHLACEGFEFVVEEFGEDGGIGVVAERHPVEDGGCFGLDAGVCGHGGIVTEGVGCVTHDFGGRGGFRCCLWYLSGAITRDSAWVCARMFL